MNLNSLWRGIKKHSPEILTGVSALGSVAAIIYACKQTPKAEEALEVANYKLAELKIVRNEQPEDVYSETEYKKDMCKTYISTGLELAKIYSPVAVLEGLSLAALFSSNNELKKRNTAIVAAYGTLEAMYSKYKSNIIEEYGPEIEKKLRNSIKTEEITEKEGKKEVKKAVEVAEKLNSASTYARYFDKTNKFWKDDPEENKVFLLNVQRILNESLRRRGYLYLNEVYEHLGFPKTEYGRSIGWEYEPMDMGKNSDGYVDFGIFDATSTLNRNFVNGLEPMVLLDFNVDGYIGYMY